MEPRSQWEVVSGPSKYDLITALSFRKWPEQKVTFKVKGKDGEIEVTASIRCIMRYDQKDKLPGVEGDPWRVYGHEDGLRYDESGWFLADYSTKTRTGWIRVLKRNKSLLIEAALGFAWAQHQMAWAENSVNTEPVR